MKLGVYTCTCSYSLSHRPEITFPSDACPVFSESSASPHVSSAPRRVRRPALSRAAPASVSAAYPPSAGWLQPRPASPAAPLPGQYQGWVQIHLFLELKFNSNSHSGIVFRIGIDACVFGLQYGI